MAHPQEMASLDAFFKPESVAVIGASRQPGKIGHEIVRNIKLGGYQGKVFPINPKTQSILGYKTYPNLDEVKSPIDLVLIVVHADLVEQVMQECARNKVKAAIIISSGFSEIGRTDLEQRILDIAKESGIRIIGPNTFGVFYSGSKLNCTFGPNYVLSGKTTFITQSGALGLALMSWTTEEKYGVSSIVSIGNKSDVDDADLVDYFSEDDSTSSILIYMEGLKNGKKFFESARKAVKKKPIIVIKAGRSKRGALAASSHTGAIAGQDTVYSAAFKEAGILRAETMTQAFDWIQAINENPVPMGENIIIVTNGGGIGVLATDKCEELGLNLIPVPDDLKKELRSLMPSFGSFRNPIDLTANADDETYRRVMKLLMKRDDVHCIIALFCQTATIDPLLVAQAIMSTEEVRAKGKPLTTAFVGGHLSQAAYSLMVERRFAAYPTTERAVDGMHALISRYRQIKGW